jgi:hypothetical protein
VQFYIIKEHVPQFDEQGSHLFVNELEIVVLAGHFDKHEVSYKKNPLLQDRQESILMQVSHGDLHIVHIIGDCVVSG